jgi:DNA-binding NarL/FixJ family response regulator
MKEDLIQIAIVDDHPAYCEGMKILLEKYKDIKVMFIALNGVELMTQLKIQQPDIILMDLDMDSMDGEEAYDLVSAKYPGISVIINTKYFLRYQVYEKKCAGYHQQNMADTKNNRSNKGRAYLWPLFR